MSIEEAVRWALQPNPENARTWQHPVAKLRAEAYCLVITFVPHSRNSYQRKAVTLVLVAGWLYMSWRQLSHQFVPTSLYGPLSAIIWVLVGRFYGIEIDKFAALAEQDWSVTIETGSPPPTSPDEALDDEDVPVDHDAGDGDGEDGGGV
ncbi:hypothetical protein [Halocalculus aciditolerans]|uniref:hypothetical protein n=1 Tax=Halocalculus aciditolerans TaxID=1383812 RepID=UPI001667A6E6|nr:hypothetical protein [Halocalculus aciditolerans]